MNKVILMGRLTRDPDIRYSARPDGTQMAIARYTLAVDRPVKAQEGQQNADFISCVAFGRLGEFAGNYLHQGTKICISGRIQTGSYTNKDGAKVYTTDVMVESQEFAESKQAAGGQAPAPQGQPQPQTYQQPPQQPQQPQQQPPQSYQGDFSFMDIPPGFDAGLPFK